MNIWTCDSKAWPTGMVVAFLVYVAAHTTLVPPDYANLVKDLAALLGLVSAALRASPLPHSDAR